MLQTHSQQVPECGQVPVHPYMNPFPGHGRITPHPQVRRPDMQPVNTGKEPGAKQFLPPFKGESVNLRHRPQRSAQHKGVLLLFKNPIQKGQPHLEQVPVGHKGTCRKHPFGPNLKILVPKSSTGQQPGSAFLFQNRTTQQVRDHSTRSTSHIDTVIHQPLTQKPVRLLYPVSVLSDQKHCPAPDKKIISISGITQPQAYGTVQVLHRQMAEQGEGLGLHQKGTGPFQGRTVHELEGPLADGFPSHLEKELGHGPGKGPKCSHLHPLISTKGEELPEHPFGIEALPEFFLQLRLGHLPDKIRSNLPDTDQVKSDPILAGIHAPGAPLHDRIEPEPPLEGPPVTRHSR